jgi:hypothetical protein
MSLNSWVETLIASQVDGPVLNTSVAATSLLPGQAKLILPSQFFSTPGKAVRIKGSGRLSNIVTTPGTFTLDVRLNSTPIIVFNGGAMQMSATVGTNNTFRFEMELVARTVGSGTATTLIGTGTVQCSGMTATPTLMPATAPAVGTGFDMTVANVIDLFGTFSISNVGNSFTLHTYTVESLN